MLLDDSIEMNVDEIEARRRAPVTEQPRLDVGWQEWISQEWVVIEIDLPDRQIVRHANRRSSLTIVLAKGGHPLLNSFGLLLLLCWRGQHSRFDSSAVQPGPRPPIYSSLAARKD